MRHRTGLLLTLSALAGLGISACCRQVQEPTSTSGISDAGDTTGWADDDDSAGSADRGFVADADQLAEVLAAVAPQLPADEPLPGFSYGPSLAGNLHDIDHATLLLEGAGELRVFANRVDGKGIDKNLQRFFRTGKIPAGSPTEQLGFFGLLVRPADPLTLGGRELRRLDASGFWDDEEIEGVIVDATCEDWDADRYLLVSAQAPSGRFDLAAARPAMDALAACE